jgi:hypothetical protein
MKKKGITRRHSVRPWGNGVHSVDAAHTTHTESPHPAHAHAYHRVETAHHAHSTTHHRAVGIAHAAHHPLVHHIVDMSPAPGLFIDMKGMLLPMGVALLATTWPLLKLLVGEVAVCPSRCWSRWLRGRAVFTSI